MTNRLVQILLFISVGLNIFFLIRKSQRFKRISDTAALHTYKEISYPLGYKAFSQALDLAYPTIQSPNTYFLVYRWDSLWYDFIFREQLQDLDSMAAGLKSSGIECVFVTEMEELPAYRFLRQYPDTFRHAKMLFSMDDFISGLHNSKDVKITQPKILSKGPHAKNDLHIKQTSIYVLLDPAGKVLYSNENRSRPILDSLLMNQLKPLVARTKKIIAD